MKNLIIIGNGFDKAHNLKTTYNEFIEDLFNNYFDDYQKYPNIFSGRPPGITSYGDLIRLIRKGSRPDFKNKFIGTLLEGFANYNWCDIEYKYFSALMKCANKDESSGYCNNPKQLNDDFEVVKNHLSDYLIIEEKKAVKIEPYEHLFNLFINASGRYPGNSLILNFNYTRIVENLYKDVIKCPIINIHGTLEDEKNPMIFGYAADYEESRELHSQKDNEYMKNIKKYLYSRTNNKNKLNRFLGKNEKKPYHSATIDVFILGHSCGLSDNLILKEIFNHDSINSIKVFYYENYENYFDVQVNMDRIMNDDIKLEKLETFSNSHRMPQWNDDEAKIQDFIKYIENN